jgi:hypothetical protein
VTEWVRTYENGLNYSESLGGVVWAEAPVPARWHRCQPQTRGRIGPDYIERCACGAIRDGACGPWARKNDR